MKIFNKRKRRTSHKHGNLGEYMLDFHVSGRIGNEPVYGLGVVDVLEIAELRSEHFLREKLAEDARGFGADVANGEVVAQKKEEVYVVFPLGTSSQGVCLHCGELEQRIVLAVVKYLAVHIFGVQVRRSDKFRDSSSASADL